jgi:hypothetical protein
LIISSDDRLCRDYVYVHFATGFLAEFNLASRGSENGVVNADTDANAWVHFGATLADDDVTGNGDLATEQFDAEPSAR